MTRRPVSGLEPFESVLERHGPAVLRFCVARLGPDRGEEAFQETLLAALGHYNDLRDTRAVGGWLFSIAQRKILDSARCLSRAPTSATSLRSRSGHGTPLTRPTTCGHRSPRCRPSSARR